jgi:GNAT superfamily N-acetyltransferase
MSVAEISNMGDLWYVNRVKVGNPHDPSTKGKGIGSLILRRAVAEILKRNPQAKIIVEPGGYSNRIEDQKNFYAKNGFVEIPGEEGVMIFKNQRMVKESEDDTIGWTTKMGRDEPEEVINVLHNIAGEFLRRKKEFTDYIEFYKDKFRQLGDCYVIHTRRHGDIVYSQKTGQWYSTLIGWEQKAPLNPNIIKGIIKHWAEKATPKFK